VGENVHDPKWGCGTIDSRLRPRVERMHDIDFEHEHAQLTEADKAEMAKFIWSQESVELNTVGIDIGTERVRNPYLQDDFLDQNGR